MTITRVGTEDGESSSSSPFNVTYPAGVGVNDFIGLHVIVNAAGTVTTPAGYTLLRTTTSGNCVNRFYGKMSNSESGTLAISFATATRVVAVLYVRRASVGFSTTLATNVIFAADTTHTATTIGDGTGMSVETSFNNTAWKHVCAGCIAASSSAGSCTLTGTSWGERVDKQIASASLLCGIEFGDDGGTNNAAQPLVTFSATESNICTQSYYLREPVGYVVGDTAAYLWTPAAALFPRRRTFVGGVAAYVWTPAAASIFRLLVLVGGTAAYLWTPAAAVFKRTRLLVAGSASYAWTPAAAIFKRALAFTAGAVSYLWTPSPASILRRLLFAAAATAYSWAVGAMVFFPWLKEVISPPCVGAPPQVRSASSSADITQASSASSTVVEQDRPASPF